MAHAVFDIQGVIFMKIIGVVGSPHGIKGNTAQLLRIVLEGAESEGATVDTYYLPGDTILPCKGCDYCHKKGVCLQKDSFEYLLEKIREADGLVLGSPNYIFNVSSQLKAFMDRCGCMIHCLGFEGKYGASVVTSGGGDEESIAEYMNHFLLITGIQSVGSVWATMGNIEGDKFPEEIRERALELGIKLVRHWREKVVTPAFKEKYPAFVERMKSLITYRKEEWPFEYEYWRRYRGLK
jgi:multimeric flavodoxin WrbA